MLIISSKVAYGGLILDFVVWGSVTRCHQLTAKQFYIYIYVRSPHARPASWVCLCSAPHVSSILPPVKQVVRSDLRYLLLFTLFKDIAARNSPRARCCATQVSAGAFLFLLPCQVEQDWTVEMLWVQCDFLIWKRQLLTDTVTDTMRCNMYTQWNTQPTFARAFVKYYFAKF